MAYTSILLLQIVKYCCKFAFALLRESGTLYKSYHDVWHYYSNAIVNSELTDVTRYQ